MKSRQGSDGDPVDVDVLGLATLVLKKLYDALVGEYGDMFADTRARAIGPGS